MRKLTIEDIESIVKQNEDYFLKVRKPFRTIIKRARVFLVNGHILDVGESGCYRKTIEEQLSEEFSMQLCK